MSFYLLPPVSYQTQQKLKSQVEHKKANSKRRSSRQHSVASHHSSNSSIQSPSIFTKNTNRSVDIDEISNLDSLSISSDHSLSKPDSKNTRKQRNQTFNYNYNHDMNEVLKFTKSQSHLRHGKRSSASASTASSMFSGSTKESRDSQESENLLHNQFRIPNYNKPPIESDDYSQQEIHLELSDEGEEPDDESEENNLTRVYSDVDSIFSTKASETPEKPSKSSKFKKFF